MLDKTEFFATYIVLYFSNSVLCETSSIEMTKRGRERGNCLVVVLKFIVNIIISRFWKIWCKSSICFCILAVYILVFTFSSLHSPIRIGDICN